MLTVMKGNGVTSTAGDNVKKGSKGRLELFATSNSDGSFSLVFADYGNYGKERWSANFGKLTTAEVQSMINSLQDLLGNGIDTTHVPFEQHSPEVQEDNFATAEETEEVTA